MADHQSQVGPAAFLERDRRAAAEALGEPFGHASKRRPVFDAGLAHREPFFVGDAHDFYAGILQLARQLARHALAAVAVADLELGDGRGRFFHDRPGRFGGGM